MRTIASLTITDYMLEAFVNMERKPLIGMWIKENEELTDNNKLFLIDMVATYGADAVENIINEEMEKMNVLTPVDYTKLMR